MANSHTSEVTCCSVGKLVGLFRGEGLRGWFTEFRRPNSSWAFLGRVFDLKVYFGGSLWSVFHAGTFLRGVISRGFFENGL